MQNKEKIWCGKAKENFENGNIIRVNLCLSDIPAEYISTGKNGKKYVKINVQRMKNVDDYSNTHSLSVDTWKPNSNNQNSNDCKPFDVGREISEEDLPF